MSNNNTITKRLSNLFTRRPSSSLSLADKSSTPPPPSVAEGPSESLDEAAGHAKNNNHHSPNMLEKLMGTPFQLLVSGSRGSGATSLVDRVFGVSIRTYNEPNVISEIDSASKDKEAEDPSKKKKVTEFVNVFRFDAEQPLENADLVWFMVAGESTDLDLSAVRKVLDSRVPFLVLLSKRDLRSDEDVTRVAQDLGNAITSLEGSHHGAVRGVDFEICEVSNPPPPGCSDCGSMSIRKKHPSGEFNGYFCSNNKCDLSLNAFKIDNQPLGAAHQLMPLIQTIKKLLLNYPSEQSSSSATATAPAAVATSVDPADAGDVAVNSNTSNDTPSATENSATAAATTAASNSSNNTNMTRNRRFQIAQLIDPTPKFDYAKVFVITSTLLAAGFGANPIPFIDAPLLVATEWALLNSICSVYGLENKSTYWGLFKNIMATPMLGLMGADMMKLIPGFGTVVGGVIDVVICATLTLSLGVAVTRMCAGAMEDRNARGNGIGVGRPYFTMDAEVGAMFKEVYNGSKEAIKGMLKSGTLSKEGLMQMVSSGGAVDASADDGSETQQLEQFASEMVHGVVVAEGKKQ